MRTLLLALSFIAAICSNAEARTHRGHHAPVRLHPPMHHRSAHHVRHHARRGLVAVRPGAVAAGGSWGFGSSLVSEARNQLGSGAIYGRSTLWCARFVNYVLRVTGHSGTGSDMASSFAHYGTRVRGPQVGAIAVMARRGGGHVGVVSGVDAAGNPIVISGNHGHRVAEAVYPKGRIYAYVLPN
jgi:uncharacterized protein (TIGR02594 family)